MTQMIINAYKPLDPEHIKYPFLMEKPEPVETFIVTPEVSTEQMVAKFEEWNAKGWDHEFAIREIHED